MTLSDMNLNSIKNEHNGTRSEFVLTKGEMLKAPDTNNFSLVNIESNDTNKNIIRLRHLPTSALDMMRQNKVFAESIFGDKLSRTVIEYKSEKTHEPVLWVFPTFYVTAT